MTDVSVDALIFYYTYFIKLKNEYEKYKFIPISLDTLNEEWIQLYEILIDQTNNYKFSEKFIEHLVSIDDTQFFIPNYLKFVKKTIITNIDLLDTHFKYSALPSSEGFQEARKDYINQLFKI